MDCVRFQTDGMRFLDGEMSPDEKTQYENHLQECETCCAELKELGRVVELTNKLSLKEPDDEFWNSYWKSVYRKLERSTGFLFVIVGVVALLLYAIIKAVTSPQFLTFTGLSITIVLVGLLVIFLSVARERYHERKHDPYRKVKR